MSQAISTTYKGPTDNRGSRIIAKCGARTILVAWDHALGVYENHQAACKQLCELLAWDGKWNGGVLKSGDHVWVRA